MIKVFTLLKRKHGMSLDEFFKYWKETHGSWALERTPQTRGYIQNHTIALPSGEMPGIMQIYDGVAEEWWPDLDSFQAAVARFESEDGKPSRDEHANFIDLSQMASIICEEKVFKWYVPPMQPLGPTVKGITLLKRKQGVSLDAFFRHWREVHGPMAVEHLPQLRGYVQNHTIELPTGEQLYDGIAETWWSDMDSLQAANAQTQSEESKASGEEFGNSVDLSQMVTIVTQEKVFKWDVPPIQRLQPLRR